MTYSRDSPVQLPFYDVPSSRSMGKTEKYNKCDSDDDDKMYRNDRLNTEQVKRR